MTVSELMQILQRFDPNLKVGVYYDCIWQDLRIDDVELVTGSESWGDPDEDSVQLFYS